MPGMGISTRLYDYIPFKHTFWMALRKPMLIARVLKAAASATFGGRTPHWLTSISITQDCNINCTHCFSKNFGKAGENNGKKELTTEEIIGFIKEASRQGVFCYDFQGGEVFLHPGLEQIISACEPHKSYIGIITNGILLNDSWAAKLVKWGVDRVSVSIDSGIPEEHDSFRKRPGTWQEAMSAVDIILKHGLRTMILTTVTHESLYSEGFRKINEYCIKKNIRNWLFIGIPVGNWNGQTDVLMDEKDHEFMAELNRKSKGLITRDINPRVLGSLKGCPAVSESIHLTSYGDIIPCPFTHISIGDIRKHSLKNILDRALTMDEFRINNPICPIGEDAEFIKKYGAKTFETTNGPLKGEDVFGFKSKLPPREKSLKEV